MSRHASIFLCAAVAGLLTLGLIMLTSTGAWAPENKIHPYGSSSKQAWMSVAGVVFAVGCCMLDPKWLRKFWPWLLGVTCVFLIMCFLPVVGSEQWGSKRWVHMPGMHSLAFQPSEGAKVICVIALAGWFARWQTETRTLWRGFLLPAMIIGVPILLVAAETDVGSALAMSVTVAAIMFCVGTRLWFLVPTALVAMAGTGFYLTHNANRWSRIAAWMNLHDPALLDTNRQQVRALYAFSNGGLTGVGLGNGAEKFGTLTLAHIDFIFPEVGEELGLMGTLATILCYVTIAVAGGIIAAQAKSVFDRVLAFGLTAMIVVPAMQNIAVVTAMLPNDGLPLPFVSYGGTSLVFMLAAVGLLCGVHMRSRSEMRRVLPVTGLKSYAVKL
jgi:cell division protein FtsW